MIAYLIIGSILLYNIYRNHQNKSTEIKNGINNEDKKLIEEGPHVDQKKRSTPESGRDNPIIDQDNLDLKHHYSKKLSEYEYSYPNRPLQDDIKIHLDNKDQGEYYKNELKEIKHGTKYTLVPRKDDVKHVYTFDDL